MQSLDPYPIRGTAESKGLREATTTVVGRSGHPRNPLSVIIDKDVTRYRGGVLLNFVLATVDDLVYLRV